jgi:uncharacterized membrane protein
LLSSSGASITEARTPCAEEVTEMPGFGEGGPWTGGPGMGHGWMDGSGYGHPEWPGVVWGLLPALVFGGLIALIVYLFIHTARERSFSPAIAQPVAIADGALFEARMRYARGEIGREDYLRIAEDLAPPAPSGHSSEPTGPGSPPPSEPPAAPAEG